MWARTQRLTLRCVTVVTFAMLFLNVPHNASTSFLKCVRGVSFAARPQKGKRNKLHASVYCGSARTRASRYALPLSGRAVKLTPLTHLGKEVKELCETLKEIVRDIR